MRHSAKDLEEAHKIIERMMLTRSCGTCSACCTSQGVLELSKPAGVPCEHAVPKKGCAIYANRPPSCAEWSCAWRMGLFERGDRPDQSGVVVDLSEQSEVWPGRFAFLARDAFSGGIDKAEPFLRRLAKERIVILLLSDGRRKVIGPPAHVEYVNREMAFIQDDKPVRRLPMFDPKRDGPVEGS